MLDKAKSAQGLAERSLTMTKHALDSVDRAIDSTTQGKPSEIFFYDTNKAVIPVQSDGLNFSLNIPLRPGDLKPGDNIHNLRILRNDLSTKSLEYQKIVRDMQHFPDLRPPETETATGQKSAPSEVGASPKLAAAGHKIDDIASIPGSDGKRVDARIVAELPNGRVHVQYLESGMYQAKTIKIEDLGPAEGGTEAGLKLKAAIEARPSHAKWPGRADQQPASGATPTSPQLAAAGHKIDDIASIPGSDGKRVDARIVAELPNGRVHVQYLESGMYQAKTIKIEDLGPAEGGTEAGLKLKAAIEARPSHAKWPGRADQQPASGATPTSPQLAAAEYKMYETVSIPGADGGRIRAQFLGKLPKAKDYASVTYWESGTIHEKTIKIEDLLPAE